MSKHVYPAVFTAEEEGGYSVVFPDLESCYTCGDNLPDAVLMAEDVLALTLYEYERDGKEIPSPSDSKRMEVEDGSFVNYVVADTLGYQKKFNKKAVKKTLTIPEWLNEKAESMGVNFSKVLQDALVKIVAE